MFVPQVVSLPILRRGFGMLIAKRQESCFVLLANVEGVSHGKTAREDRRVAQICMPHLRLREFFNCFMVKVQETHLNTSFLVELVQLLLPSLDCSRLTSSKAQLGLVPDIVLLLLT